MTEQDQPKEIKKLEGGDGGTEKPSWHESLSKPQNWADAEQVATFCQTLNENLSSATLSPGAPELAQLEQLLNEILSRIEGIVGLGVGESPLVSLNIISTKIVLKHNLVSVLPAESVQKLRKKIETIRSKIRKNFPDPEAKIAPRTVVRGKTEKTAEETENQSPEIAKTFQSLTGMLSEMTTSSMQVNFDPNQSSLGYSGANYFDYLQNKYGHEVVTATEWLENVNQVGVIIDDKAGGVKLKLPNLLTKINSALESLTGKHSSLATLNRVVSWVKNQNYDLDGKTNLANEKLGGTRSIIEILEQQIETAEAAGKTLPQLFIIAHQATIEPARVLLNSLKKSQEFYIEISNFKTQAKELIGLINLKFDAAGNLKIGLSTTPATIKTELQDLEAKLATARTMGLDETTENPRLNLAKKIIQDKAVEYKSILEAKLFELLANDLILAQAALEAKANGQYQGEQDLSVELERLKIAKSELETTTQLNDQMNLLKINLLENIENILTQSELNQWLRKVEATYVKLKPLKTRSQAILSGNYVYQTTLESLRVEDRNALEIMIDAAKAEVAAGVVLSPDEQTRFDDMYFAKAQMALDMVIREQARRIEEDQDFMNMDIMKLADIINGWSGFGLIIEDGSPPGLDPLEAALRTAYHDRLFMFRLKGRLVGPEDPNTHLAPLSEADMRVLEAKMKVTWARMDNKMNASNAVPDGNRGAMGSELFASLSIEKDEVIHGLTAHPLYGGLFCELTQRMIWAIGLKKGWEVDGDGKIAKADTSTNPKVRYNKRYDYGSNICASGGKVELKSLIEETFNTLIAEEREILMNSRAFEANPANRARLEETHNKRIDDLIARKDYISELAYHMYLGGNLLDKSLALRQRIGEQTKSHDSKTAKNFSVANDPFPDLDHKVNRYEKGFELSTALFLIFYPELKPQDLLDMGIISDTGDTEADNRARAKIAKMKIWRKLIIQYFNITGASLKGVTLENNKPMEFPRPGNSQDLEFLSAYCPTGQTSVAVEPIRAPEWGEEVFPSVYTVLTDPIYRDHQNWDQYYKAETSWIKFMDTIAAPVPADVTIDKIMGTNNDGLLTTIVESPILGMAKLVKGKHFDYVPPMLTFYIQELISNLHPNTKDSKARALKRIVQKLDNVSMRGLSAMYPQIQKVISNLIGDARFDRMVEGQKVKFDSEFISPDDFDLQKPILEYTHLCEKFVNEQFDAHAGEHPDLKVSLITGMPVERVSTWFASPDERARFREEVLELHEGGIQTPYGTSLAPSQEKTTEEAK